MLRLAAITLLALLLAGCQVIVIPVPIVRKATPAPVAQATPPPAAPAGADFAANYAAVQAGFDALRVQLDAPAYADPAWQAETIRLAQEWRTAIDTVRAMPQPEGEAWAAAWPLVMAAMDDFAYSAGAVEGAAEQGNQSLLLPVYAKLANAINLMTEATRILEAD